MSNLFSATKEKSTSDYPHIIIKENLGTGFDLTDFYIRYGANFFVFSYEKNGEKKHTFIDTGYAKDKDKILPILGKNDIHIQHIENIILTHRHSDHCGLTPYLASQSNARIIVHSGFKAFVDGPISPEDKIWLRGFEPWQLKTCHMDYRNPKDSTSALEVAGLKWPVLGEPVQLGNFGQLDIFGCPEGDPTHTPDQIIVHFTPTRPEGTRALPTDTILFSGDLWLMQGPVTEKNLRHVKQGLHMSLQMLKSFKTMRNHPKRDPRLQDAQAKEALKYGFVLVRVKPGHGNDFIGTRFIPKALLADRDLLIKLGYSMNDSKVFLRKKEHAEKLIGFHEEAYTNFIKEIRLWKELGYENAEVSQLLARIYLEQKGGGRLAAQDRVERRQRMKDILSRMLSDDELGDDIKNIAGNTKHEVDSIK